MRRNFVLSKKRSKTMSKIFTTQNSYSMLLLRVALGIVMGAHGVQKAFGWFGGFGWDSTIGYFNSVGLPTFLGGLVILIESLGAFLLIIGFAGRINAALMGIVMIGAFFIDHLQNGFFMNWFAQTRGEGFEFDILFCAIAAVLTVNGSGALSVDRYLMTKRSKLVTPTLSGAVS
jgi:Predicted membrane protein